MWSRVRLSPSTAASTIQDFLKLPITAARAGTATTRNIAVAALVAGAMLLLAAPPRATAQLGGVPTGTPPIKSQPEPTQLVEWDITDIGSMLDGRPGAITVDIYSNGGGRVWFVTREGMPRVFMFQPPRNLKSGSATWMAWDLDPGETTGGLKKIRSSYDRRFVFVRTLDTVQKIDTQTDLRTTYAGVPSSVSDMSVDNRNHAYFTFSGVDQIGMPFDVLARLDASVNCNSNFCPPANVTYWNLGPTGAANCVGSLNTSPCISGVAVHPKRQNLVYVSEQGTNDIAEVDTTSTATYNVRRWDLGQVNASEPEQLNIDNDGVVWVVTGSGHLVSLDPRTSRMASYAIPRAPFLDNETFGIAPDGGMIGYTATANTSDEHKVGMLVPKGKGNTKSWTAASAPHKDDHLAANCLTANRSGNTVPPHARKVMTRISPDAGGNGTFIEAFINKNIDPNETQISHVPLGITPNFDKATGTFFYAVGEPSPALTVDRIGFARLPRANQKGNHEREDKDCDDDGSGHDDEAHDGIPDRHKTGDSHADMHRQNDQLAAGQSSDYTLTAGPRTMALVAAIQADNLLAPVSAEIIDPNGISLALPVATPGLAVATIIPSVPGDYIVRVKNEGVSAINHETQLLTREPLTLP